MVVEKKYRAQAYSVLPFCWSLGTIIGPAIGGTYVLNNFAKLFPRLANPVKQYPKIFGHSVFFKTFPYVLPNLVTASLLGGSWILAFFFLKETLQGTKDGLGFGLRPRWSICYGCTRCYSRRCGGHVKISRNGAANEVPDSEVQPLLVNTHEDVTPVAASTSPPPRSSILDALTSQIIINIFVYAGLSLHSIAFDELFPIFCATRIQDGGLSMSPDQIGTALSITGTFGLIFNIIIFPKLYNKFGAIPCLRMCSALFISVYFVILPPRSSVT